VSSNGGSHCAPLSAGDLRIDPNGCRVWRADTEVTVTARQFELLEFLVRRAGRVVGRDDILLGVWGFD
jgi:DNA-binding response OmpR family regulator